MLQFLTLDAQGRRLAAVGHPHRRADHGRSAGNSLLVSAPPESMELIAALIDELDQMPTSTALRSRCSRS